MPADDTLWSDQNQMAAPVATKGPNHHPEQLVAGAEPRSLPGRARQYRELMLEQEILGNECLAVADDCTGKAEEKEQVLEHCPNIMTLTAAIALADFCTPTGGRGACYSYRITMYCSPRAVVSQRVPQCQRRRIHS
jgi:hypothetical protein